jgi:single-strand DNA-binding protein
MADLKLPRLNKAFIAGRITQDLELRYTPKGTPTVRFTVAMDKRFKDESDQWQSVPIFVDVVAWSNNAENLCKSAHKGSAILVEGRIESRSYTDQNNVNRKVFEIIAESIQTLEWKPKGEGEAPEDDSHLAEEPTHPANQGTMDDVPF